MTKYLCDIIPLAHLPLSRGASLWYESNEELSYGTLVRVPLFRRTVTGVVLSSKDDFARAGGIALKSVAHIIAPAHFTMRQIALATHISETTFTPLGVVLESFLIPRVNERTAPAPADTELLPAPALTPITQQFSDDIIASLSTDKYWLLRDSATTARDALYISLIAQILSAKTNTQILILLPEVLITVQTAARLSAYFPVDIIGVIHHKTAAGTLNRIRDGVRAGTTRIIIGTRKSLALPFDNLTLIITDEEHDMSFKQWDRAPRFDARNVARFMTRIYSCPLVAVSAAPRITHTLPLTIASEPSTNPVTIADMRAEKEATARGNTPSIISEVLRNAIEQALASGEQVMLFINHKGTSAFSICSKCRTLLACPDCDRALIGVQSGHYECVHCSYSVAHAVCADCQGVVFCNVGYGTQRIASLIARLFPTARIQRVDGHSLRRTHAAADITQEFSDGNIDILIGTQMALKDWRVPTLTVVGIIDADALRAIPDIHADERLYAFIANAAAAVTHTEIGTVIVQTFHPNYPTLTDAVTRDYDTFRTRTLATRKMLHYPPDWRAVKIILQHRDDKRVARLADTLHATITASTTNDDTAHETIIISSVHAPLLPKLRTYHRLQILIRLRNPDTDSISDDRADATPIPTWLATILRATPPHTTIDIDPVSLV